MGVDLLEVQHILGHTLILSTAKYTRLTRFTGHNASDGINRLMDGFTITSGDVR